MKRKGKKGCGLTIINPCLIEIQFMTVGRRGAACHMNQPSRTLTDISVNCCLWGWTHHTVKHITVWHLKAKANFPSNCWSGNSSTVKPSPFTWSYFLFHSRKIYVYTY